jgi:tungstate transport system substrate-binding protein
MNRRMLAVWLVMGLVLAAACGSADKPEASGQSPAVAGPAETATQQARRAPANPRIVLATTTSTVDSGLLDELLPLFEQQTGYKVVPLSLGSGQAIATAERGEADILLVHSPDAEKKFMEAGHGIERRLVMHNDFVIVGPAKDPAGVASARTAAEAMQKIAAARATFVSRGDNSGTHALEKKLWQMAKVDPAGQSWYVESGTGMGQTLQISSDRGAYTIADRGTYLAQRQILSLTVLGEKDPALLNVYHVILVNPAKTEKINAEGARALADFFVAPETQRRIGEFGKAKVGEPLFVPDAGKDPATLGL